MLLKCTCGSRKFRRLGIQGSWLGRTSGNSPRNLYLVNCTDCGTTKSCSPLQYALLQSRETDALIDYPFFNSEKAA